MQTNRSDKAFEILLKYLHWPKKRLTHNTNRAVTLYQFVVHYGRQESEIKIRWIVLKTIYYTRLVLM